MKLKPGEVICDNCTGQGYVKKENNNVKILCLRCYGTGKLDWIENIVGKSFHLPHFNFSYGPCTPIITRKEIIRG